MGEDKSGQAVFLLVNMYIPPGRASNSLVDSICTYVQKISSTEECSQMMVGDFNAKVSKSAVMSFKP